MREERECPYCAEMILARAKVCKHCRREVVPLSAGNDEPLVGVADSTPVATSTQLHEERDRVRAVPYRSLARFGGLAGLAVLLFAGAFGAYTFFFADKKPKCDYPDVLGLVKQIHTQEWEKDAAIAREKYVKGEISPEDQIKLMSENPILYGWMMQMRMAAQMMQDRDSVKAEEARRGAAFDAAMNGVAFDYSAFVTKETESKVQVSCEAFVKISVHGKPLREQSFTYHAQRTDDGKNLVGSASSLEFLKPTETLKLIAAIPSNAEPPKSQPQQESVSVGSSQSKTTRPEPVAVAAGPPFPNLPTGVTGGATASVDHLVELVAAEHPLIEAEVVALPATDLRLLRNAVFARHGRTFNDAQFVDFFSRKPWYHPSTTFSESALTAVDRANLALLQKLEKH